MRHAIHIAGNIVIYTFLAGVLRLSAMKIHNRKLPAVFAQNNIALQVGPEHSHTHILQVLIFPSFRL